MESVAFRCLGLGLGLPFRPIPILHRLGQMLLDYSLVVRQISDRAGYFEETVENAGA